MTLEMVGVLGTGSLTSCPAYTPRISTIGDPRPRPQLFEGTCLPSLVVLQ
jgi:hypothetical protein